MLLFRFADVCGHLQAVDTLANSLAKRAMKLQAISPKPALDMEAALVMAD